MTRRRKPFDPAASERRKAETRAEVERLEAMGAEVNLGSDGKILSAWRSNVFTVLLRSGAINQNHHHAAMRLAEDWAIWKGLAGSRGSTVQVDGGAGSAELVSDAMIQAGRRVARALAAEGLSTPPSCPRSWWPRWRKIDPCSGAGSLSASQASVRGMGSRRRCGWGWKISGRFLPAHANSC